MGLFSDNATKKKKKLIKIREVVNNSIEKKEKKERKKRKNNKYVATLPGGKKIHFGSSNYLDFLIHEDKERRERYLARAKKIKNKNGELTFNNPESANYWSVKLLW